MDAFVSACVCAFIRVDVCVCSTSDCMHHYLIVWMVNLLMVIDVVEGQVLVVKMLCRQVGLFFEVGQQMYGFL